MAVDWAYRYVCSEAITGHKGMMTCKLLHNGDRSSTYVTWLATFENTKTSDLDIKCVGLSFILKMCRITEHASFTIQKTPMIYTNRW